MSEKMYPLPPFLEALGLTAYQWNGYLRSPEFSRMLVELNWDGIIRTYHGLEIVYDGTTKSLMDQIAQFSSETTASRRSTVRSQGVYERQQGSSRRKTVQSYSSKVTRLPRRSRRKPLGAKLRFQILRRDNYECQLCGHSAKEGYDLEVDHRVPVARGGSSDPSNLWTLCFACNRGKGILSLNRPASEEGRSM